MRFSLRFQVNVALMLLVILPLGIALLATSGGAANASVGASQTNWVQFGFNAQHTGYNPFEKVLTPANVSKLTLDWKYPKGGDVHASSAVVNGVIYFGSSNKTFYALDATTGTLKWGYSTGGAINSAPAVIGGIAYFGSGDAKIYALDAATGALKWSYSTGGAVNSAPAVVNGVVYIGSADHKLYALDAATGKLKWSYATGGIIDAAAAVSGRVVYVGSNDATLYALGAVTGKLKWSYSIQSKNKTVVINAAPVVANGSVYFGSFDFLGANSNVYSLNALTGKANWSYAVSGCGIDSSPTIANGVLYVGSDGSGGYEDGCVSNNNLFALNATTGNFQWSTYIGGPDSSNNSSPTVANGVLYVGSNDFDHTSTGGFALWYAINAKSGTILWSHLDNAPGAGPTNFPNPAPVVVNGVFYISSGAYNGYMHAFHLPGGA